MLSRILVCIVAVLGVSHLSGADLKENPALDAIFKKANVTGAFVLYNPADGTFQTHNLARAKTRYTPASTFKIVNTLIGLEAGSVANVDEILPYGGGPQYLKIWEKDMSLRDAIKISNVPIYQELARRTGLASMQKWLTKLDYGNADAGKIVDRFWLDGPLAISAIEQTSFLARLAGQQLPIQKTTFEQVSDITITDRGPDWILHSKTGLLSSRSTPRIGWWVGWVEKAGETYTFALNIDVVSDSDIDKRVLLGRQCLAVLGIIPEPPQKETAPRIK